MRLNSWLVALFGGPFVRIQLPIDVAEADNATSEPEPDAAILSSPGDAFLSGNPGPDAVLLFVEVADTGLRFDLRTKAQLYARAGIVDYWVLDLAGRRLVQHRQPADSGYRQVMQYAEDEAITPLSRPDAPVLVADPLPPEQ